MREGLTPLVLWGATGQAKVLRELTARLGYEVVALFDNDASVTSPFAGVPIFHGGDGFQRWRRNFSGDVCAALVAIGGSRGRDRHVIQQQLAAHRLALPSVVHPAAFVADNARLGSGTQVLPRAAVMVDAVIGEACIINTAASVDHECRLGHGVHVCPGATLAGCVDVGNYSTIGSGAVILPHIKVGSGVIVGAGAVVTRDTGDNVVVFGNPARVRRPNDAALLVPQPQEGRTHE